MRIQFRQGIVRAPAGFLQPTPDDYITLNIPTGSKVVYTISDSDKNNQSQTDYLFEEDETIDKAWGPIVRGVHSWLFWDIHPITGIRTFGVTYLEPVAQPTAPLTPVNDQHWFDTVANCTKVWNSTASRWIRKIRVFACMMQDGLIPISMSIQSTHPMNDFIGTQIGELVGLGTNAGFILFDTYGKVLKKSDGTFFTSEDTAVASVTETSAVKIASLIVPAIPLQPISSYSVVRFSDYNTIVPAYGVDIGKIVCGIIAEDLLPYQSTNVVTSGIVQNKQWDFESLGWSVNTNLYVDPDSKLTNIPQAFPGIFAIVVGKHEILIQRQSISGSSGPVSINTIESASIGWLGDGSSLDPLTAILKLDSLSDNILEVTSNGVYVKAELPPATVDGYGLILDQGIPVWGPTVSDMIWGDIIGDITDQLDLVGYVTDKVEDLEDELALVAFTGSYNDLINTPILGSAAFENTTAFATAAQGIKADSAVQPAGLLPYATIQYVDDTLTGYGTIVYIDDELNKKVDKVAGQGLSDTNYTQSEKDKLAGIEDNATENRTDAATDLLLDGKVDKVAGKQLSTEDYTTTEKNKLAGIENNATENRTDAATDLLLDNKVDKVTGKQLSTEDYTTAEKNKLAGIENNATQNRTDAATDLLLDGKVDKVPGQGLSDTNYTQSEKDKLAGLESSHYRGQFVDLPSLISSVANPVAGDYADVDAGAGSPVSRYIWDTNDSEWVKQSGEVSPITASEVKTLYESNADTNVFTDSEKSKLSGIQANATANQTDTYLLDRTNHTGSQAISTITGLQTALDSKTTDSTLATVAKTGDYGDLINTPTILPQSIIAREGDGTLSDAISKTGSYIITSGNVVGSIGDYSVVLGGLAEGDGQYSTSIGFASKNITADGGIAIGYSAINYSLNGIAVGPSAQAGQSSTPEDHTHDIAIGYMSSAVGHNSISIGRTAISNSSNSVAIGQGSNVGAGAPSSIVIGESSGVGANQSIAIGYSNYVGNQQGIAIGSDTLTMHDFSVSLGAFSRTSKASQISVANLNSATHLAATPRLISGVATPVVDQDATNKLYVDTAIANIPPQVNSDWLAASGSPAFIANKPLPAPQLEAEAGTSTTSRLWSSLRVRQAITAAPVVKYFSQLTIPTSNVGPILVTGIGPMEWNGSEYEMSITPNTTMKVTVLEDDGGSTSSLAFVNVQVDDFTYTPFSNNSQLLLTVEYTAAQTYASGWNPESQFELREYDGTTWTAISETKTTAGIISGGGIAVTADGFLSAYIINSSLATRTFAIFAKTDESTSTAAATNIKLTITEIQENSMVTVDTHNLLSGIQGGISGDRQHLTTAQVEIVDRSLVYLPTTPVVDRGPVYVEGEGIMDWNGSVYVPASKHNQLSNIQGGDENDYQHLTSEQVVRVNSAVIDVSSLPTTDIGPVFTSNSLYDWRPSASAYRRRSLPCFDNDELPTTNIGPIMIWGQGEARWSTSRSKYIPISGVTFYGLAAGSVSIVHGGYDLIPFGLGYDNSLEAWLPGPDYALTPPLAGLYRITANITGDQSVAPARMFIELRKNGSSYCNGTDIVNTQDGFFAVYTSVLSTSVVMNGTTDFLKFYAYSFTHTATNMALSGTKSFFTCEFIK